ncbi:hypothetical protein ACFS5L_20630 [Streptomyces phyllanthi]|uniref:hypothetical protein n=1 Tax=Streptomyces phyllanthi TaxID=1803180 RepID=UPI001883EEF0|nr:hypothetical protein [Streptomyces phyllanthi]
METARQYDVHEAESPWPEVRRMGRGSLRGRIHIADDCDELPDDIADAFGMR